MNNLKITRNTSIASTISKGVEEQKSALNHIRNAALQFVDSIKGKYSNDDIPAIVSTGRDIYRADFDGNSNLVSWFGDVATLALAKDAPVSFPHTKTVEGKKIESEVHTTGTDAAKLAKHQVRSAAKALRDDLGQGRAEGGGRKPQTEKTAPAQSEGVSGETVFSPSEFKRQLNGLFGHSKNPSQVLNKFVESYGYVVVSKENYDKAINAAKAAPTKARAKK
jgi:hypothetical protein